MSVSRETLGFDGTEDDVDYEAVYSRRPRYGMYVPHMPVDLHCSDPSLARQEFAEESDINSIMKKYERTGIMPMSDRQPFYGDFTDLPSYMDAQNIIIAADEAFSSLPANVRREFDNDPAKFVEFASDKKNLDKMREWGLAEPLEPVQADPAVDGPPAGGPAPKAPEAAPAASD